MGYAYVHLIITIDNGVLAMNKNFTATFTMMTFVLLYCATSTIVTFTLILIRTSLTLNGTYLHPIITINQRWGF